MGDRLLHVLCGDVIDIHGIIIRGTRGDTHGSVLASTSTPTVHAALKVIAYCLKLECLKLEGNERSLSEHLSAILPSAVGLGNG